MMKRLRSSFPLFVAQAALTLVCFSVAPAALAADDATDATNATKRAQTVTRLNGEGTAFFKARDFRRALDRFNEAYALEAEPDLLYNIARCHEALGETATAIAKYTRYVEEPGADAEGRARAQEKLRSLKQAAPAAPAAGPKAAPSAGSVAPATAPATAARSYSPWTWITLGIGGAAAVGGSAAFLLGVSDHGKVTDDPGYGQPGQVSTLTRARAEELIDSGDRKKTIGVALWGVGGAALVTSTVLFLLERSAKPRERAAWLGVTPAKNGGGFSLQGRF
ncbi:MAG: tetratricopeptide repeat protein [Polyangiaceae bacterium]|nr:tetratricopeptide repeat protein [Polyangiaceae bacterium]